MHPLQHKMITQVKLADDKMAILFICTDGEVKALADAVCCSSTWIEHVSLPALGFPAFVHSVESIDMPDYGSPGAYEVIQYYGLKITTDKGDILIDYRNESNGYYSGNLVWPDNDESFWGGVHGQNISTEQWQDLTEDI